MKKNITSTNNTGVYISANDNVYDWTIAFLNSFREFNPNLHLILIPFNKNCKNILSLKTTYNFDIYEDNSFNLLEDIGQAFELGHTKYSKYWFRRYSAFWGPLDNFLFLDVRRIILGDISFLIDAPRKYSMDLMYYDCAINQVYNTGTLRNNFIKQGKAKGFMSGQWASHKNLFSLSDFEALSKDALEIRQHLNARNTDQAFFNYCCDIKNIKYAHFADVIDNLTHNTWARRTGTIFQENNSYKIWDHGGNEHLQQIPFMHWAGITNNLIMPFRKLFIKYLYLNKNIIIKLIINLYDTLLSIPFKAIDSIRRLKFVNTIYHFIIDKNHK